MRVRLEAAARGPDRRTRLLLPAWRAMLATLEEEPNETPEFADWFEIARDDARDADVGLKRHWIDPTIPFADTILKPAHCALFTAVKTLKATYTRMALPLAAAGLTLYAQHVDALDTGTLVDLFRAEENACLLGTDALRDGVDVPGRSLRLCIFDKVPWPKPTILHKARRARFGKTYDDLLARLRLKQAFGRLIRSETDKGVFVILDAACPRRLLAAP